MPKHCNPVVQDQSQKLTYTIVYHYSDMDLIAISPLIPHALVEFREERAQILEQGSLWKTYELSCTINKHDQSWHQTKNPRNYPENQTKNSTTN